MADGSAPNGLVELLDRLLDTGVVVAGQVTITLADVDLVDLDLRALLTGVEASRQRAGLGPRDAHALSGDVPSLPPLPPPPRLPERVDAGSRTPDGIGQLVLLLVDLLRQVLTSQAVARLEAGSLTEVEVERLGRALLLLEQRCEALREFFATDRSWNPIPLPDRSASR
jgi:hypothetical protein